MNTTWLVYMGRKIGMNEEEVLACPLGDLLDYMACMQIENGADQKIYADLDTLAAIR